VRTRRSPKNQQALWKSLRQQPDPDRKKLLPIIAKLVRDLTEHISVEAKAAGVTPEEYCPCLTTDVAEAKALLTKGG